MMFNKGKGRFSDPKHIRRARAYLEEARMAMLEHSIAAEHYRLTVLAADIEDNPDAVTRFVLVTLSKKIGT